MDLWNQVSTVSMREKNGTDLHHVDVKIVRILDCESCLRVVHYARKGEAKEGEGKGDKNEGSQNCKERR